MRQYHGWVIVESAGPGYRDYVFVERNTATGRIRQEMSRGESGAAEAVEWWEKELDQPIKLERLGGVGYRVYTIVK